MNKVNTNVSKEMMNDLKSMHGIDIVQKMESVLVKEISKSIRKNKIKVILDKI